MKTIDKIIIHCSATPEGRDVSADTIRNWHVKENRWRDIGYHYVIELDGTIVKGRSDHDTGAHTAGHNRNSLGICYVGGLGEYLRKSKDTRTENQIKSLKKLLEILLIQHPGAKIAGHNQLSKKMCPSFDVPEWCISEDILQNNIYYAD